MNRIRKRGAEGEATGGRGEEKSGFGVAEKYRVGGGGGFGWGDEEIHRAGGAGGAVVGAGVGVGRVVDAGGERGGVGDGD